MWERILSEIAAAVIAGIFAPPIVAMFLSLNQRAREWLKEPWVVSALTTISIATIVSVLVWAVLPFTRALAYLALNVSVTAALAADLTLGCDGTQRKPGTAYERDIYFALEFFLGISSLQNVRGS
jgi:hypothetical protein